MALPSRLNDPFRDLQQAEAHGTTATQEEFSPSIASNASSSGHHSTQSLGSSHLRTIEPTSFTVVIHHPEVSKPHYANPGERWLDVRKSYLMLPSKIFVWAYLEGGKPQSVMLSPKEALVKYTEFETLPGDTEQRRVVHIYFSQDAANEAGQPVAFSRLPLSASHSSGSPSTTALSIGLGPVTLRSADSRSPLIEPFAPLAGLAYGDKDGLGIFLETLCTDWGSISVRVPFNEAYEKQMEGSFTPTVHPLLYTTVTTQGGNFWSWTLECAVLPMAELLGRCLNQLCDGDPFSEHDPSKRFQTTTLATEQENDLAIQHNNKAFYTLFNKPVLPSGHSTSDLAFSRFLEEADKLRQGVEDIKDEIDCLRRLPILPILFAAHNIYAISKIIEHLSQYENIQAYPNWNSWELFVKFAPQEVVNASNTLKAKIFITPE